MRKLLAFLAFASVAFAQDEALEESLSVVKESYDSALNAVFDASTDEALDNWFKERSQGKYASWAEIEFEKPEVENLEISEILYGLVIKSSVAGAEGSASIRFVTRDENIRYQVTFEKNVSAAFKKTVNEVFDNGPIIFSKAGTPCTAAAVTCVDVYAKGTNGRR